MFIKGELMDYNLIKTTKLYEGKVFRLVRQQIQTPSKQDFYYDILEHPGAVTIVPVTSDNMIIFVRQYRPAVGGLLLELPAGTLEKGELPELCANRELREETGMSASNLKKIGEFYLVPGYSTEYQYIFLAQGLSSAPLIGDEDEFLSVEQIHIAQVYNMVDMGKFLDAKSIAALTLARPIIMKTIK